MTGQVPSTGPGFVSPTLREWTVLSRTARTVWNVLFGVTLEQAVQGSNQGANCAAVSECLSGRADRNRYCVVSFAGHAGSHHGHRGIGALQVCVSSSWVVEGGL